MSMINWAEKEIELACARERASSEEMCDYGIACYQSALKAFKSLLEDEHSGYSIGVTKNILNRLIDYKPLTPIEDTPDIWNEIIMYKTSDTDIKTYQCTRMSSLFKDVYSDGTTKYSDVQRTVVTYVDNPGITWSSGTASEIINELYPITMPYAPSSKQYVVYAEEFLVDPARGDDDTVGYLYVVTPEGEKVEINRFFKDTGVGCEMVEIDRKEFENRRAVADVRILKELRNNEKN